MEDDFSGYRKIMDKLAGDMPQVVLAYLFGSTARGERGPLSDYDFAVYLDETDPQKRFNIKLKLMGELSRILKNDNVDVVIMNDADNVNLKYAIINEGKILYEKKPYKTIIESKILNEYFDFKIFIDKYQKIK